MSQVLLALEFMHDNNYIYRDLKPENIMIDKQGNIKLTDFGLSKILKPNETTYTLCGTAEYLAPEIIFGKGYDKTCDWFSFGVVIFEMFCGYHPFRSKTKKIDPSIYLRKTYIPDKVGKNAKDLIEKLFVSDPKKRLGYNSADEVKNHPFFKGINWDNIKECFDPPFIPELQNDYDTRYFDEFEEKEPFYPINDNNGKFQKKDMCFVDFTYNRENDNLRNNMVSCS